MGDCRLNTRKCLSKLSGVLLWSSPDNAIFIRRMIKGCGESPTVHLPAKRRRSSWNAFRRFHRQSPPFKHSHSPFRRQLSHLFHVINSEMLSDWVVWKALSLGLVVRTEMQEHHCSPHSHSPLLITQPWPTFLAPISTRRAFSSVIMLNM